MASWLTVQRQFAHLLADARRAVPELQCVLRRTTNRGLFRAARAYAFCELRADGSCRIVVAPDFEDLAKQQREALLRHELAHAIEFAAGRSAVIDAYALPPWLGPERRADAIAEAVWGDPIRYDAVDVQTLGDGATPRPRRLGR